MNYFSIRLWHVMKRGLYMSTGYDQLSGWTEKLQRTSHSQIKLAPNKGYRHCLVVFCPSEPLQLSKSWRNHYICKVCSANQWDAPKTKHLQPGLVNRKDQFFSSTMLNGIPYNQHFKSWTNWASYSSEYSSFTFTCSLANQLPLLQAPRQLFTEKALPQPAGCRKCFPRVRRTPKHSFLCHRNKQTYFLLANKCWIRWFLFWLMCLNLVIMS